MNSGFRRRWFALGVVLAALAPLVAGAGPGSPPVAPGMAKVSLLKAIGSRPDRLWTADRVVFDRPGLDGCFDVWAMNADGSGEQCLTDKVGRLPQKHNGNPAWRPSGKFVVFQSERPDVPKRLDSAATPDRGMLNDLWVASADGKQFWRIRELSGLADDNAPGTLRPRFSHSGKKLLWAERLGAKSGVRRGEWALAVADFVDDREPKLLGIKRQQPLGKIWYEPGDFSPDDQKALFAAERPSGDVCDVFEWDLASGKTRPLAADGESWNEHPRYSPDGSRIVWASSRDLPPSGKLRRSEYWIMNADGKNKRRLTWFNAPGHPHDQGWPATVAGEFAWSPDGKKLIGSVANGAERDEVKHPGRLVTIELP